jgi:hypothetical protein
MIKIIISIFLFVIPVSSFSQDKDSIKVDKDSIKINKDSSEIKYTNDDSTELIIRRAIIYTRKFPSEDEIKNTKAELWLLRIYFGRGVQARPVLLLRRDGKKFFVEYDTVRKFESQEEALKFANENDIKDIELE